MSPKRGVFIAGNWKMNHGAEQTRAFFAELSKIASESLEKTGRVSAVRSAIFPPMLSLPVAIGATQTSHAKTIEVGAQNVHWSKSGAYTGEISAEMALECGVRLALVGHSERRQYFGETDETVRKRAEFCLSQGLDVMICVGETLQERESGQTESILSRQLDALFAGHPSPTSSPIGAAIAAENSNVCLRVTLAYEPVWAIGTGVTATPEQAQTTHAFIRRHLTGRLGDTQGLRILYGGSVTPDNVSGLLACPDVDGGLVGGASLKPEGFLALLKAALQAYA